MHPSVSGNRRLVGVTLLEEGSFLDRNGEFQLELSLSRVRSVFEHKFKVSQSIFSSYAASRMAKFETSYFSFGVHDWSLALYPTGRSDSQIGEKQRVKCKLSPRFKIFLPCMVERSALFL